MFVSYDENEVLVEDKKVNEANEDEERKGGRGAR